jgi:hypothetical protein
MSQTEASSGPPTLGAALSSAVSDTPGISQALFLVCIPTFQLIGRMPADAGVAARMRFALADSGRFGERIFWWSAPR